MEGKAERLADKLVPYTFLTTGLTYLFTRNLTKATSVLMVDFCCALKLSMPIAVLSAIKEARNRNVNVKGGKFLGIWRGNPRPFNERDESADCFYHAINLPKA